MVTACVEPRMLYRPRDPLSSDLWRLLDEQVNSFRQVFDERYQARYGYWRLLERADAVPGMIAAVQTHGEFLHWHPHMRVLITCGEFTPEGVLICRT